MKVLKLLPVAVACAYFLGGADTASAQLDYSHIACVKVSDAAAKAIYTADIGSPFGGSTGCVIKVPAKVLCYSAVKQNVTPTPPGGGPSDDLGVNRKFLCYKAKCPNFLVGTLPASVTDQFGVHPLSGKPTKAFKMFCAPASPSGAFLD